MQVKLRELYQTKYFYATWQKDLQYMFGVCRQLMRGDNIKYNAPTELHKKVYEAATHKEAVIFDVAGCKLGPECATAIRDEQRRGTKFVDSEDPYNNKILKDNEMRVSKQNGPEEPLPPLIPDTNVKEYIKNLKSGVCYTVPTSNSDQYVYMIVLIEMTRPKSVTIDATNVTQKLFHLIATNLTVKALNKHTAFYFQNEDIGPIGLEFRDGKAVLPGVGEVTISDAANYGELIPIEFGSVRLLDNPDWFGLKEFCLANVNNFVARQTYKLEEVV